MFAMVPLSHNMILIGTGTKQVQPQHAAACRSTLFLELHMGVLKHAAACRSIHFFGLMCLSALSVDNLHAKTIKGRGKTQAAANCFNPELLQTKEMMSYSELCKHIPNVPQSEWVRYIALPAPSPLPDSTAARVAWWHAKKDDFPTLSSIAVFFVRRPRSACHVERTFSLMGHIQTKDRLHMGNDTLRHLAMMYVNKPTTDDPDGESD